MKIRTRLTLLFLLLVGLSVHKLVNWILADLRPLYLATMEESMIETASMLSSLATTGMKNERLDIENLRAAMEQAAHRSFNAQIYELSKTNINMRVYITDRNGIVIYDSQKDGDEGCDYSKWNDVYLTMNNQYGARATRTDPEDPKTLTLYVASPIVVNDQIVGVLSVGKSVESVVIFQNTAQRNIIRYGIITSAAIIFMGIIFSSWITSPIEKLTAYALAVRDGKRPIMPKLGHSEIGKLGEAFEDMRDTLEDRQYVENYVQTLTHEMKSPLSAIRGAAELLQEEMPPDQQQRFLANIQTETGRIQNLIDRLLLLSVLESRKGILDATRINLSDLLKDIASSMYPQLKSRQTTLHSKIQDSIIITGELFFLRQAIVNLLQNAIDFTPRGGSITLTLQKKNESIELTVSDSGSGIPDFAISRVCERFYSLARPDTGLKSSGLGLTFVRETALLHDGDIEIANNPDGGTRATLRLPLTTSTQLP